MNSTFLFDKVRNKCLLTCPTKTYYDKDGLTCADCS